MRDFFRPVVEFMARERRVPLVIWAGLGFGAIAVEAAALSTDLEDNWVYVGIYCGILLYCLYARAILPIACTTSLVVLRSLVATGTTGFWLGAASVTFATLYLLLIVDGVKNRERRRNESREKAST